MNDYYNITLANMTYTVCVLHVLIDIFEGWTTVQQESYINVMTG